MTARRGVILALVVAAVAASVGVAQYRGGRYRYRAFDRAGVPEWENDPEFADDVFTFVRIRYQSGMRGWRGGGGWHVDYPDSDLNFSYRLQELTSMEVAPDGLVLELTDPRLFDYPFIYMIEPGLLVFSQACRLTTPDLRDQCWMPGQESNLQPPGSEPGLRYRYRVPGIGDADGSRGCRHHRPSTFMIDATRS